MNRQHVDGLIRKYRHQLRVAQKGSRIVVALGWTEIGVEVEGEGETLPDALLALNRELSRISQTKRKASPKMLANLQKRAEALRATTICKRGHPLERLHEEKQRRCRICSNAAAARYRARRKIAQDKALRGVTSAAPNHSFPKASASARLGPRGLVNAEQLPPGSRHLP